MGFEISSSGKKNQKKYFSKKLKYICIKSWILSIDKTKLAFKNKI